MGLGKEGSNLTSDEIDLVMSRCFKSRCSLFLLGYIDGERLFGSTYEAYGLCFLAGTCAFFGVS